MSLAERKPPRKNLKERCTVCVLVESLPESESKALQDMLASHLWSGAAISRALYEEGLGRINDNTVRRHRRGECFREFD